MSSPQPLIHLSDVKKVFYTDEVETHALSGIHLDIQKGEYVSIAGPSGCGKSTLLSILGLLDTPTDGEYVLNEKAVENLSLSQRARIRNREVGFIFQSFNLIGDLTVYENVELPLTYRGMNSADRKSRVTEALERVGMAHRVKHLPSQLSGGQQQRVALARALVLNPDILLLDEPLSNLDAKIRIQVRGEIRQLQQQLRITTLYVTHDQEEALSLSDRVAVMREGRIQQVASPKALYERPANRFVADFVGTNNFIPGVCQEHGPEGLLVETALGLVRGRPGADVVAGARCVLAVRPENVRLTAAADNVFEGRVALTSYLGTTLRYDVEIPAGLRLKVDVGDAWHHEVLPVGWPVRVGFAASVALTLPDE
jgi:ABC-type Fe3+/spermidine/putrescine transport system ATPase subunit